MATIVACGLRNVVISFCVRPLLVVYALQVYRYSDVSVKVSEWCIPTRVAVFCGSDLSHCD